MKNSFKKTNLDWCVSYDYERSNCHCHDYICRCTTIKNTWIESIDVKKVVEWLYDVHSKTNSEIDKYCFDRICHAFNIYDKYLYEVKIGGGYYGEEIYGIYFDEEEQIVNTFEKLLELETDLEKIKFCLKLEYGYLLDCAITATSANVLKVITDLVVLPNREYFRKVNVKIINDYKDSDLPVAVCYKDGDRYRLVDGYHRFVANNDKEKISIIVLE